MSSFIGPPKSTSERLDFALYLPFAIICLIKLLLYVVDPGVKVILGDSGSYLATAVGGFVPSDRSYTYGLFLGFLLHIWYSLHFLVMVQVALSAASAMLLTWVLYRVLAIPALTAGICGIACALEPLQLLSERYIMSEAVSTCFFAVVICLAYKYLQTPKLRYLLLIAIAGTVLVSFRVYFLPALLITSVYLPVASKVGVAAWRELKLYLGGKKLGSLNLHRNQDLVDFSFSAKVVDGRFRTDWKNKSNWPAGAQDLSRFALHLFIAVISLQLSLSALRTWYGHEIHGPPAYIEDDGLFLLAELSPIVHESDFRDRELGRRIYANLHSPQHELESRKWNRWGHGGLIDVLAIEIKELYPSRDQWEISKIARRTALRALLRHPVDAAHLVLNNVGEYFSVRNLEEALINNEFVDVAIIPSYQRLFLERFGWKLTYQGRSGPVRELHQRSAYWCLYLALCPFLASGALLIPGLPRKRYLLYGVICTWPLWCLSLFLPEELAPRYFTGLSWLLLLLTGVAVQGVVECVTRLRAPISHPAALTNSER